MDNYFINYLKKDNKIIKLKLKIYINKVAFLLF